VDDWTPIDQEDHMKLWVESGLQREQVAWALITNGYTVKQITRPDKEYPYTRVNHGLEYEEPENKK
jgi:hypothetical protein